MSNADPTDDNAHSWNYYELAFEMWRHQHERWKDWVIFYFGTIAAIFAIWSTLKEHIPLWTIAFTNAFLSFVALCCMLSIRRMSEAWLKVIEDMEDTANGVKENHRNLLGEFKTKLDSSNGMLAELCEVFWTNWTGPKGTLVSATKMAIVLTVVQTLAFTVLGAWTICCTSHIPQDVKQVDRHLLDAEFSLKVK